ncbi:hypothetical protein FS749_004462 [Ceratobasidium sp. UAMH 11750]|nr:hypothetical protein FS749_004462 [Ceratobasidium sp. UAMH 11750]
MLFARFFAAALVLVPAVQVLAAPASINTSLSIRESPSPPVQELASLEDILTSARTNIKTVRSHLNSENPQSAEDTAIELKATFDNLIGDLKSLKKATTDGKNSHPTENPGFDPKTWPMVSEAYAVSTDILSVVDEIKGVASTPTAGGKRGVAAILGVIVYGVPALVALVTSILGL